jgi:hypothetical protein
MPEKQVSITKDATATILERSQGLRIGRFVIGLPFFRLSFRIGCIVVSKGSLSGMQA